MEKTQSREKFLSFIGAEKKGSHFPFGCIESQKQMRGSTLRLFSDNFLMSLGNSISVRTFLAFGSRKVLPSQNLLILYLWVSI